MLKNNGNYLKNVNKNSTKLAEKSMKIWTTDLFIFLQFTKPLGE